MKPTIDEVEEEENEVKETKELPSRKAHNAFMAGAFDKRFMRHTVNYLADWPEKFALIEVLDTPPNGRPRLRWPNIQSTPLPTDWTCDECDSLATGTTIRSPVRFFPSNQEENYR